MLFGSGDEISSWIENEKKCYHGGRGSRLSVCVHEPMNGLILISFVVEREETTTTIEDEILDFFCLLLVSGVEAGGVEARGVEARG